MLNYIFQLISAFLLTYGMVLIVIELRSRFDRVFLYYGISLILLCLFASIDIWILAKPGPALKMLFWNRILHVLVLVYGLFALWYIMLLVNKFRKKLLVSLILLILIINIFIFTDVFFVIVDGQFTTTIHYIIIFGFFIFFLIIHMTSFIIRALDKVSPLNNKILKLHLIGIMAITVFGIFDFIILIVMGSGHFLGITSYSIIGILIYGILTFISFTEKFHEIINDSRRAEEEIRKREENLVVTLNSIDDGVIVTDTNTRIIRMNPVAEQLTGWQREAAAGKFLSDVFRIINIKNQRLVTDPIKKVIKNNKLVGLTRHAILIAKDNKERIISNSGSPIHDKNGKIIGVVFVFRDITEEQNLQEQIRQMQKMDAIGKLAGGIAHDFNNLLTGILGSANILKHHLKPKTKLYKLSLNIERAAEKATEFTQQLLGFARKGKHQMIPVNIHKTIKEVLNILERTIDKNIKLTLDFYADDLFISGDPVQIQQMFFNLVINSRDAMPQGGGLSVQTDTVNLDYDYCNRHPGIRPGKYILIIISDTGYGIPKDIQQRIFEPFFTTKEQGQGTGMGLAMVYGIVKNHDGFIYVDSQKGRGASFQIFFPPVKQKKEKDIQKRDKPLSGTGRILLIDDEEIVRDTVSEMLKMLGYQVVMAGSAREAIDYYRVNGQKIDLVIIDMIMPKMSGHDCFLELKKINPNIRALLSTGYSKDGKVQEILNEGVLGFIQKPFKMKTLGEQLNQYFK